MGDHFSDNDMNQLVDALKINDDKQQHQRKTYYDDQQHLLNPMNNHDDGNNTSNTNNHNAGNDHSNHDYDRHENDRMTSLEIQLEAMNSAFNLQEKVLSMNGQELAALCLQSIMRSGDASSDGSGGGKSSSSSEKQMLIDFPYYRLLQLWRKKVTDCLIHRTLQEKHIENITRKIKKERNDMLITINKYETESLILKQKYIINDAKYKVLVQASNENHEKLMNITQEKNEIMKKLQEYTTSFENIFLYLKNLQLFLNKKNIDHDIMILNMNEKIKSYHDRIHRMKEDISFLNLVMNQKEVQVRNSLAAINAEKRLLQWYRHHIDDKDNDGHDEIHDNRDEDKHEDKAGRGGRLHLNDGYKSNHNNDHGDNNNNYNNINNNNDSNDKNGETNSNDAAISSTAKNNNSKGRSKRKVVDHNHIQQKISSLRISPQVESLLRSIFRNLDPNDTGMVVLSLLLSSILNDYGVSSSSSSSSSSSDGGSGINNNNNDNVTNHSIDYQKKFKNMVEFTSSLSSLGILISRALGIDRLYLLIKLLLKLPSSYDLTWGEFLLQLIPTVTSSSSSSFHNSSKSRGVDKNIIVDSSNKNLGVDNNDDFYDENNDDDRNDEMMSTASNGCALTIEEMKELRSLGLLGDLDWGVLPLALPSNINTLLASSSSSSYPSSLSSTTAPTNTANYSKYEERLLKERNFCLHKLQNMSRELERRAENINSYFIHQKEKLIKKNQILITKLNESENQCLIYKNRINEINIINNEKVINSQSYINKLEKNNEELQMNIKLNHQQIIEKYENLLLSEKNNIIKLETELNIVQRENSKKEVKCRALSRDIHRYEIIQNNQTNEIIELKEKLSIALLQIQQHNQQQLLQQQENKNIKDDKSNLDLKYFEETQELKGIIVEKDNKLNDAYEVIEKLKLQVNQKDIEIEFIKNKYNHGDGAGGINADNDDESSNSKQMSSFHDRRIALQQKGKDKSDYTTVNNTSTTSDTNNTINITPTSTATTSTTIAAVANHDYDRIAYDDPALALRQQMDLFRRDYGGSIRSKPILSILQPRSFTDGITSSTTTTTADNGVGGGYDDRYLDGGGNNNSDSYRSNNNGRRNDINDRQQDKSEDVILASYQTQQSAMAAHLSKLVRLAEQAINGNI